MKKILLSLIALMAISTYSFAGYYITIRNANNAGVVLRDNPNEGSKRSRANGYYNAPHFYTGNQLYCTGTVGNYYQVSYNGYRYYIPKKYAYPSNNYSSRSYSNSSYAPSRIRIRNANNAGVVLRRNPNEGSKLSRKNGYDAPHFFTGDVLSCTGISGSYYRVSYGGGTYYIPKKYAQPY